MRTIQVKVKPNARASRLEETNGVWIAQVKSSPVDGKANRELLKLIAGHFKVPRSRVRITGGAAARIKRVQIEN